MDCQYYHGRLDSPGYCELNESLCSLETGYPCDIPDAEDANFDIAYHSLAEEEVEK
mgnify:CR=1 FL=1